MKSKLRWLTAPTLVPGKFTLHEKRWVYLDPSFNISFSSMLSEDSRVQKIAGAAQIQRLYLANQVVGYLITSVPGSKRRLQAKGLFLVSCPQARAIVYKVLYKDSLLVIVGHNSSNSIVILPNLSETIRL
jgi:hypothetical protein